MYSYEHCAANHDASSLLPHAAPSFSTATFRRSLYVSALEKHLFLRRTSDRVTRFSRGPCWHKHTKLEPRLLRSADYWDGFSSLVAVVLGPRDVFCRARCNAGKFENFLVCQSAGRLSASWLFSSFRTPRGVLSQARGCHFHFSSLRQVASSGSLFVRGFFNQPQRSVRRHF